MEADHFGDDHRDRLAEHRRLRLDPADAPAEHAEPVDHRRMAVGADERIGISDLLGAPDFRRAPDPARDIFQIDLVADARPRRHHLEIVERALAPFEEFVALDVALIFQSDVLLERHRRAEGVDHHAVIDDEVDGNERIDLLRIAAEPCHRITHRRQIDDRGHAGEILHQHPRRAILDLLLRRAETAIRTKVLISSTRDRHAVLEAQQIFEQHLHRERQFIDRAQRLCRLGERIISIGFAAHLEAGACAERVLAGAGHVRRLFPIVAIPEITGALARHRCGGKGGLAGRPLPAHRRYGSRQITWPLSTPSVRLPSGSRAGV